MTEAVSGQTNPERKRAEHRKRSITLTLARVIYAYGGNKNRRVFIWTVRKIKISKKFVPVHIAHAHAKVYAVNV